MVDEARDEAIRAAAQATRWHWLDRRALADAVERVEPRHVEYTRALVHVERRTFVRCCLPAPWASAADHRPLEDPPTDPWTVDPETIGRESRVPIQCPDCDGAGKLACEACDASGWRTCRRCAGEGCRACSERGGRRCLTCAKGRAACATCGASGHVEAWWAVCDERRWRVCHDADESVRAVHPRVADARDFDAGPERWAAQRTSDSGWVVHPDYAAEHEGAALAAGTRLMTPTLPLTLEASLDHVHDRLLAARVQCFRWSMWSLPYALPGVGGGRIQVGGSPPRVIEAAWRPIRARRMAAALVGVGLGFAALFGFAPSVATHVADPWSVPALLLLAASVATTSALAVLGWLVPRRSRTFLRTHLPVALATAMLIAAALPWITGRSRRAAERRASATHEMTQVARVSAQEHFAERHTARVHDEASR